MTVQICLLNGLRDANRKQPSTTNLVTAPTAHSLLCQPWVGSINWNGAGCSLVAMSNMCRTHSCTMQVAWLVFWQLPEERKCRKSDYAYKSRLVKGGTHRMNKHRCTSMPQLLRVFRQLCELLQKKMQERLSTWCFAQMEELGRAAALTAQEPVGPSCCTCCPVICR